MRTSAIELVIFDMDGVVFEGRNFWLDLHHAYGTEKEALELAEQFLIADYEHLGRLTTEVLWRGRPGSVLEGLVRSRQYQPGIEPLFEGLREQGIRTAIISSGPFQLAQRAQAELGIDVIRANEVEIVDGEVTGQLELMVMDTDKGSVATDVMKSLGVERQHAAGVGDTESDLGLFDAVGLSVAYDSDSEKLNRAADRSIAHGDLIHLLEVLGVG